jgi:hypothetical protein
LKSKINNVEKCIKNRNIRDLCRCINEFRKGYKHVTNFIKDEKGNLRFLWILYMRKILWQLLGEYRLKDISGMKSLPLSH